MPNLIIKSQHLFLEPIVNDLVTIPGRTKMAMLRRGVVVREEFIRGDVVAQLGHELRALSDEEVVLLGVADEDGATNILYDAATAAAVLSSERKMAIHFHKLKGRLDVCGPRAVRDAPTQLRGDGAVGIQGLQRRVGDVGVAVGEPVVQKLLQLGDHRAEAHVVDGVDAKQRGQAVVEGRGAGAQQRVERVADQAGFGGVDVRQRFEVIEDRADNSFPFQDIT